LNHCVGLRAIRSLDQPITGDDRLCTCSIQPVCSCGIILFCSTGPSKLAVSDQPRASQDGGINIEKYLNHLRLMELAVRRYTRYSHSQPTRTQVQCVAGVLAALLRAFGQIAYSTMIMIYTVQIYELDPLGQRTHNAELFPMSSPAPSTASSTSTSSVLTLYVHLHCHRLNHFGRAHVDGRL
jgi:hypothetical protein